VRLEARKKRLARVAGGRDLRGRDGLLGWLVLKYWTKLWGYGFGTLV
jgi:hypothetical protein